MPGNRPLAHCFLLKVCKPSSSADLPLQRCLDLSLRVMQPIWLNLFDPQKHMQEESLKAVWCTSATISQGSQSLNIVMSVTSKSKPLMDAS